VSDVDIGFAYLMICGFIVVGFSFALHLLNKGKGIRA
jgi:ABC-2 type transport system permease protein